MALVIAQHTVPTVACTIAAISVGVIVRSARSDYEHRVPSSVLSVHPKTSLLPIRSPSLSSPKSPHLLSPALHPSRKLSLNPFCRHAMWTQADG